MSLTKSLLVPKIVRSSLPEGTSFSITLPGDLPAGGKTTWMAEVYGPNGVSTDGFTVKLDPLNSSTITILPTRDLGGDLILFATYSTPQGGLIRAQPFEAFSVPVGKNLTGITMEPKSAVLDVGASLTLQIWGIYDETLRTLLFNGSGNISYSSSNPEVAEVDGVGKVHTKTNGGSTITASYKGFSKSLHISSQSTGGGIVIPPTPVPSLVDTNFFSGTGADGDIHAVAIDGNGRVLIGGDFLHFNEKARTRLARLNGNGNLDETFNPGNGLDDQVLSICAQSDSRIIVSGFFVLANDQPRNYVARFDDRGSLDAFNPSGGPDSEVDVVSLSPDGKIVLAGTLYGNDTVNSSAIARFSVGGVRDVGFVSGVPGTEQWGPGASIYAVAFQPDGKTLIGGDFDTISDVPRQKVARLMPNGTLDPSFAVGLDLDDVVRSIAIQGDGMVVVGGGFSRVQGERRNGLARLDISGRLDKVFAPDLGAFASVNTVLLQKDGGILVGGDFRTVNEAKRGGIVRLLSDGRVDQTFDPKLGADGEVAAMAIQPDGKIVVAGSFTHFDGWPMNRLVRLHSQNPATNVSTVRFASATLSAEGSLIIGVSASIGSAFVVQTSQDLVHWEDWQSKQAIEGTNYLLDSTKTATGPKFYRAILR